ncbi:DUF695 domain-containing protein [Massilia sp. TS11]|uniref:DUF695 domain-containing protein n=1 Tax=Massilia sp. TS11 TaxID=2908003 RepID=UPI001EDC3853|nr:DUF695 domain-containing protein [Massilia sp. TS11]MCG2584171.1 DUF695 domain-containing protein [Massilia sp. TS11]
MWPFKKHLPIETLDDDNHKWSIVEAKGNGGPMIVRFNETAKSWARHPALDIRVGFAVPFKAPNPDGQPVPEEDQGLSLIEDSILSHVRKLGPSVQVLAITTGTFKEFVFYVGNAAGIADVHKQIVSDVTSHEVQCVAERDPKWSVYDAFAKSA